MTELLYKIVAQTGEHAPAAEHAEEAGGIGALGLDPLAILAQAVTFLLLFWIVKRFALEKIVNTLEERRKTIDKGVRLGIHMQAEQDKLADTIEQKLQEVRKQADTILAEANQEAGAIVKQAEATAQTSIDTMLSDARARIEDDVQKAKRELKKETIDLVAAATEIIIDEKLDAKKDSELIERALEGAKNG